MEFLHPVMWHDHDIDFARWLHPANVIRGSGMTSHWICPNVCHIDILHLVSISTTSPQWRSWHVILHQSPKFYQNRTILGRKKWRRFSRCRISAILYFMGPIMASSNSPFTTSYSSSIDTIALNCLAFDNRVFAHSLAERSATGMVVA